MKFQNWLIYSFTTTVLFIIAILCAIATLVQLPVLITGGVFGFDTVDGVTIDEKINPFYNRIVWVLPGILITVAVAYVSWQLSKMLHSIGHNNEFHERNYERLNRAGLCIVFVNMALLLLDVININVVRNFLNAPLMDVNSPHNESSFSFFFLLFGFILIILSKAFQRGAELQKDVELTF